MKGKFLFGPSVDEYINLVLESLTDREKMALIYKFGIGGHACMTYEQIGNEFGINRDRVRTVIARALRKIRRSPTNMKLIKEARHTYSGQGRKPAICHDRPPEWAMNKYHGAKGCD